jgi:hypothetical protein
MRCRREKIEHPALAILYAWEDRERHLYAYEAGARGEALRERREFYRVLASKWRQKYETAILSDQDLSREARWGDDSDVRFVAGVSELRTALRQAFAERAIDSRWRDGAPEEERSWCERRIADWIAGGAREVANLATAKTKTSNAWAGRKARAKEKEGVRETARKLAVEATECFTIC